MVTWKSEVWRENMVLNFLKIWVDRGKKQRSSGRFEGSAAKRVPLCLLGLRDTLRICRSSCSGRAPWKRCELHADGADYRSIAPAASVPSVKGSRLLNGYPPPMRWSNSQDLVVSDIFGAISIFSEGYFCRGCRLVSIFSLKSRSMRPYESSVVW